MAGAVIECPKCKCQLEVKVSYAAGPKRAGMHEEAGPAMKGLTVIGDLLDQCEQRRDMNAWEKEFVASLRERYEEYGDRVKLSEKQQGILESIAEGRRK